MLRTALREAKTVRKSSTTMTQLMMPTDAAPSGHVYGGTILRLVDMVGAVVAYRHARRSVVTASIDRMDFYSPVRVGSLIILKSSVNYVGRTSMEIGVRIEAEDLRTGVVSHTGSSYLTFVALDEKGKPTPTALLKPETKQEKRRFQEARLRRRARMRIIGR